MRSLVFILAFFFHTVTYGQAAGCIVNNQLGTSYTTVLSDANQCIAMNNASANTVTIPLNASVPYPRRTALTIQNQGAGTTSINVLGTWNFFAGAPITLNQYQALTLRQTSLDVWQTESVLGGGSATSVVQVGLAKALVAVASLTVTSIPGSYSALQIVVSGRAAVTSNTSMSLQFNGDSGSNYDNQVVQGIGTAAAASESLGTTAASIGTFSPSNAPADRSATATTLVANYASTSLNKTGTGTSAVTFATGSTENLTQTNMWVWRPSTPAAITSVTVFAVGGNIAAGSSLAVYGLP